ncbi:hypothetical protein APA_4367 [Pseudanabaena sp. lw0831]|uniref:hypothetical protein n=1 Tax=Pseudanabaena sp. lw0831 TaxID=1357935 RepID=UPI0019168863|nr:hypothetical protein [Pseudanabaena sp. lw0831]GBO52062.1 hypothetical protein APA_4367 [Pseudanabaena sp. lw0831]
MKQSNNFLTVIFLFSLIAVLLISTINTERYYSIPYKSDMTEGPKWEEVKNRSEQNIYKHIRYIYVYASTSTGLPYECCADAKELDEIAQTHIREEKRSHYGQRKWYWKSLPVSKNEYVILIWYDLKQKNYDWIAVKDTPAFWYTIRKDGKKNLVIDGQQLVCSWYSNKKYIEIRVKNPLNIKGTTPLDFWYSFADDDIKFTNKQIGSVSWISDFIDNTCHAEAGHEFEERLTK